MKYIFFGTPEFAAIVLEKLINAGYIPEAVVCNPDEPVGRKQILTPPPTKILAGKFGINILQPEILANYKLSPYGGSPAGRQIIPLRGISRRETNYKPDLGIIAAYGKIIPKEILDIPVHGFVNIHGSLLPCYRGASPIQAAILDGKKETGVTIMKVDEKMDHGPIISDVKIQILNYDTFESLSQKLAILGADLLITTIPDYISGKIKPVEQDHSKATYTKIIKKEDGKIDWSKSAKEIERMVRAYYPWPSSWTLWNGKVLKILEAEVSRDSSGYKIGEVLTLQHSNILQNVGMLLGVKCGDGVLIIKKLQLEGGKVLNAKEFLNGHKDFIKSILQ